MVDFDRVRSIYNGAKGRKTHNSAGMEQRSVTDVMRRKIKDLGGKSIKLHGGPMSSGHPDIIGCLDGIAFVIETKRQGGRGPTERQQENIRRWAASGAVAFWTDDPVQGMARLVLGVANKRKEMGLRV